MSFAAPTVLLAVDSALTTDSPYMAVAVDRGVYTAGKVPQNQRLHNGTDTAQATRFGYAELGSNNENTRSSPTATFGAHGGEGALTITVRAMSEYWALKLASLIHTALDGKPLPSGIMTADSQALVEGAVNLVEDFENPDGGHSAVLRYETLTVSTA